MQKIGILGTGMVGYAIGTKLIELGYEIKMGARNSDNAAASKWVKTNGKNASQGTFADAAAFGELVFNSTKGEHALEALKMAEAANLASKTLIDISNPLEVTSDGVRLMPAFANTYSLGEAVQDLLPQTHVVKTLNLVNCDIMTDAARCGGEATMFVAGNNADAKKEAQHILAQFGWKDIIDLGDIAHARSMEMLLPIWLSSAKAIGHYHIGFKIVR